MLRLLPLQENGQNQHEKGGGRLIRHGRIIRILRYLRKMPLHDSGDNFSHGIYSYICSSVILLASYIISRYN